MSNEQFKDLATYIRSLFQFTILFILIMTLFVLASVFISLIPTLTVILAVAGLGLIVPAFLYAKPAFKIEDKWLTNNLQD